MAARKTAEKASGGIYQAILEASKAFPEIGRDKQGNWGSYGSLPAILRAVRAPLADQGVVITQPVVFRVERVDEYGTVEASQAFQQTILTHAATGESLQAELPLPEGETPQKMGATQTYYRRYLLQGLLALAPDDIEDLDDPDAPNHLEQLRDLSLTCAKEAFGDREDIDKLAALVRKAAFQITGIRQPDPSEAITFAAAIRQVHLEVDEQGEPRIQTRPTGPDPLLQAVCDGEVAGDEIPITPVSEEGESD